LQKASKKALITGASSGIGRALAELLYTKGYQLSLFGRNQNALLALQQTLPGSFIFTSDLSTKEGQNLLYETIEDGSFDLLVNSAGIGFYGEGTVEEACEMIEINCKVCLASTLHAIESLKKNQKEGLICNISSSLAFIPTPYMATYAASKAFVNNFSLAKDEEVKEFGIRVLTVCPGQVASDFRFRASRGKLSQNPHFFLIRPEKVAELIYKQIEEKKALSVIDWKTWLLVWCARFFPVSWVMKFMKKELKKLMEATK
jgi:uncharacterized protein